jgi:lysophospholipase L1-like esterase
MDDNFTLILFLVAPPMAGGLLLLFLAFRFSRTTTAKPGAGQILLFNLVFLLVLSGLSFAGGELYYRYIYDTTDSLAYTRVAREWGRRYIIRNAAGFRDNIQYYLAIPPGKRRISFLGDSFTAGHGVKSVEDRFPNLIRAEHPEWEVHVLAELGWDTGAELAEIQKSQQAGYQLDTVVLVYCLNDVADLFPEWNAAITRINDDAQHAGWLRRHSFFFDILYHRYKAAHDPYVKDYYRFVREGYRGPIWEMQKQRLTVLRDLVQSQGAKFMVVTFPFLQALGDHYEYQPAHNALNQLWRELQVPHLDLLSVYGGLRPDQLTVNPYDAHPNEYANSLAAKAINSFLETQIKTNMPAKIEP